MGMAVCGWSQGSVLDGTKADPVGKPVQSDPDWTNLLQMAGATILVGSAVKWLLPKWLKSKPRIRTGSSASLRVVETAGIFQIVEAEGRRFLVSANPSGATLIAELTEEPTAAFADHLQSASPDSGDLRHRVAAAAARLDNLIA